MPYLTPPHRLNPTRHSHLTPHSSSSTLHPQRTLYRAGLKRLEEEFRSVLDRASPAVDTAAVQVHDAAQAALAAKGDERQKTLGV